MPLIVHRFQERLGTGAVNWFLIGNSTVIGCRKGKFSALLALIFEFEIAPLSREFVDVVLCQFLSQTAELA
jgi:hypothetical protein